MGLLCTKKRLNFLLWASISRKSVGGPTERVAGNFNYATSNPLSGLNSFANRRRRVRFRPRKGEKFFSKTATLVSVRQTNRAD